MEGNSNEKWTRAERKHEASAFKSSVFEVSQGTSSEGCDRMEWCTSSKPKQLELDKLAKKRHFKQKCETRIAHVNILIDTILPTDETTLQ